MRNLFVLIVLLTTSVVSAQIPPIGQPLGYPQAVPSLTDTSSDSESTMDDEEDREDNTQSYPNSANGQATSGGNSLSATRQYENSYDDQDLVLGERDPFKVPSYIKEILDDHLLNQRGESFDGNIESIRRWPLGDYKVIGIMWDVKEPKVMIEDKNGNTHMVRKNTRIGNRGGIITEIKEGEIVVKERDIPIVISISKSSLGDNP